ncbi:Arm DNA-binding domain-containing protein, partial [Mailhella massiliensis]|uniref:Arm DNA-binding domain-containing protein n=1 Tax=Mailhella massiliensis TaxID=1903261 RepID=UPI0030844481
MNNFIFYRPDGFHWTHRHTPFFGVYLGVNKPEKEDYPMSLTDTAIRAAKPAEKQQKLFDAKGLYLLIMPSGTKSWRLKYHFQGKEKLISLGTYPATSLKEAREKAADARKAIENGIDPSAQRKLDKQLAQNTF